MKTKKEAALEAFDSGFNCAQAVVSAFCDKYGVDKETALKLSGGMGSGFRTGEICGAASGGTMVVGLKYGQHKEGDKEAKQQCGAKTKEFLAALKDKSPSILCRDILKQEPPAGGAHRAVCAKIIAEAVDILEQLDY